MRGTVHSWSGINLSTSNIGMRDFDADAGASGSVPAPSFPSGAGTAQPAIQYRYWDLLCNQSLKNSRYLMWHVVQRRSVASLLMDTLRRWHGSHVVNLSRIHQIYCSSGKGV